MEHTIPGKLLLLALVAGLALLIAAPLVTQAGDGPSATLGTGYGLTWSTVDGGGYTFSRGGGYTLGGTAGQPDAGLLTGGGYQLSGGFWARGGAHGIYLPLVMRH
ncbi:MAG: hypothetical protein PVH11_03405 [Anaerolineae bacterium]|jgi:hypothetical protein